MSRWFFGAGSDTYEEFTEIEGVLDQLRRMSSLFQHELTYTAVPGLPARSADTVRRELGGGPETSFGADDTVVVYYSGHGYRDGGRHYLVCEDTVRTAPAATALPTEDLVRQLAERGARRLLLIIDTCEAGAGGAEAASTAARLVLGDLAQRQDAYADRQLVAFSVLCASRAHEAAYGSAFCEALEAAVKDEACGGVRARKLLLETLVDHVNARLGHQQHATHATFLSDGDEHPFFPNPRYWDDAPPEGVSLAEQEAAWHARDKARGIGRGGTGFVGRADELDELDAWVRAAEPRGRWLAVTGVPGVGKSALLREFHRRLEESSDRPDEAGGRVATLLVDMRRRDLGHLSTCLQEWSGRAAEAADTFVLLVDGVEEAGRPDSEQPRLVAEALSRLAATDASLRVVATASDELAENAGADGRLDLDLQDTQGDMNTLAVRLLTEPFGPGSRSGWSADQAERAAPGLVRAARGNHLLLRLIALRMAAETPGRSVPRPQGGEKPWTVATAFWELLRVRCRGDEEARHIFEMLLTGLAFSRGAGLPRASGLWQNVVQRTFGPNEALSDKHIRRVLDLAAPLLAEGLDQAGRSAYRLHHEAYAEALRHNAPRDTAVRMRRALRDVRNERTLRHPDLPADPCLAEQDDRLVQPPAEDSLAKTLIEKAGTWLEELFHTLAALYPSRWNALPETFLLASTRGSVAELTTDEHGQEVWTLRVPRGGRLYVRKISRLPRRTV